MTYKSAKGQDYFDDYVKLGNQVSQIFLFNLNTKIMKQAK